MPLRGEVPIILEQPVKAGERVIVPTTFMVDVSPAEVLQRRTLKLRSGLASLLWNFGGLSEAERAFLEARANVTADLYAVYQFASDGSFVAIHTAVEKAVNGTTVIEPKGLPPQTEDKRRFRRQSERDAILAQGQTQLNRMIETGLSEHDVALELAAERLNRQDHMLPDTVLTAMNTVLPADVRATNYNLTGGGNGRSFGGHVVEHSAPSALLALPAPSGTKQRNEQSAAPSAYTALVNFKATHGLTPVELLQLVASTNSIDSDTRDTMAQALYGDAYLRAIGHPVTDLPLVKRHYRALTSQNAEKRQKKRKLAWAAVGAGLIGLEPVAALLGEEALRTQYHHVSDIDHRLHEAALLGMGELLFTTMFNEPTGRDERELHEFRRQNLISMFGPSLDELDQPRWTTREVVDKKRFLWMAPVTHMERVNLPSYIGLLRNRVNRGLDDGSLDESSPSVRLLQATESILLEWRTANPTQTIPREIKE